MEKKRTLDEISPEKQLASELHRRYCKKNHVEECGWQFEIKNHGERDELHDWEGYSHKQWLQKAKNILDLTDKKTVIKVLDIIEKEGL